MNENFESSVSRYSIQNKRKLFYLMSNKSDP